MEGLSPSFNSSQTTTEDCHNNNNNDGRTRSPLSKPIPTTTMMTATSDIEEFQGKIVYNPDGSAYIIEGDADLSEEEALLDLPRQEGSIIEKPGQEPPEVEQFPTIENAIYVARTRANNYPSYVRAQASRLLTDRPTVHSYRVYNYRQNSGSSSERRRQQQQQRLEAAEAAESDDVSATNVPVKPILMCFICKLSFGNAKSFKTHCADEHGLDFNEDEAEMLRLENVSALIQPAGRDKSPLLSFLEPVATGSRSAGGGSSSAAYLLPSDQPVPIHLHSPAKSPGGEGGIRVRNDLAAFGGTNSSQISPVSNGGRSSTSPGVHSLSPSPSSFNQFSSGLGGKGTTIGACPEHLQGGRPTGVECAKCDLILSAAAAASRLGGGPAAAAAASWNASNNACKTLKCPKCNWHYKYQETLEIHMKEKHPESETTCIYCITGQQHPRLARGETYTCGYKPYRCEICNYSTTTKGNLSIHMQSDKHINNMQELQNSGGGSNSGSGAGGGGDSVPSPSPSQGSKYATPSTTPKPPEDSKESNNSNKPCWRCDVCNYETNIARNLRIHMTSEKHMNNVMNLQQLQGLDGSIMGGMSPFPNVPPPSAAAAAAAANLQHLLGMSMLPGGLTSSPLKEAAMADIAFNQALLMQMMGAGGGGGPGMPGGHIPGMPPLPFLPPAAADSGQDPADMDQADPNPRYLYNCAVCREFSCDHLQSLSDHLAVDRTKLRETEVSILIGGTYICKLCSYKTNLKANFQLHCKTDKHLQKLQLVNHIMEGGPANEWKLNFMNVSNSVQLRCNACDFYTDSIHKLQIHSANQGHEVSAAIFGHLRKVEQQQLQAGHQQQQLSYNCTICSHGADGKALLLQHCRSVKHLQMEQLHLLQRRAEGATMHPEIGDIFTVTAAAATPAPVAPEEERETDSTEGKESKADSRPNNKKLVSNGEEEEEQEQEEEMEQDVAEEAEDLVTCPLCQEGFRGKETLEEHAMQIHSINSEGLQRLMMLMQGSHWLNNIKNHKEDDSEHLDSKPKEDPHRGNTETSTPSGVVERSPGGQLDKYTDPGRPYKCDVCRESFTQKSILLVHYNSVGHLRNVKKKMQEQQQQQLGDSSSSSNEGPANTSGEMASSELDRSGFSDSSQLLMASPKKEEKEPANSNNNNGQLVLGEIQNALQQAMIAARLQLLNPMLRAQLPPPPGMPQINPMAAAMGLPHFGPPGMGQLQQLQQLAMAQQMSGGGGGGGPRMPDPASLLLSQLAQLAPGGGDSIKSEQKLPFPPPSPVSTGVPSMAPDSPMFGEQKRARTKITEDQLKILRSNFDISNSPSDEQISIMAGQTGLPPKVIKHWFRNTLFKERQKNKDSPYNFNNPPSTMINLEEYEKTGEPKVMAINNPAPPAPVPMDTSEPETRRPATVRPARQDSPVEPPPHLIRLDHSNESSRSQLERELSDSMASGSSANITPAINNPGLHHLNISVNFNNATNPVPNVTQSSLPASLTLSSILSSQTMADSMALSHHHLPAYPPGSAGANSSRGDSGNSNTNPFGQSPEHNSFSKMLHNLAANSSCSYSEPSSPQGQQQRLSPGQQQDLSGIHGKRANRTRFSDYQVKVLQEFFEKNAYPKDDDLEYLSKLLGLTPRVIVVWFQNARQKARKAYENQPSNEMVAADGPGGDIEGRFTRTPSLSYQCKKCNLEFQRYYELIRHQKQHCYKEEDAKRSALAQKAAAVAAATLTSQGGGSSNNSLNLTTVSNHSEDSNSSISYSERNITSPVFNQAGSSSSLSWKRKPSLDDSLDESSALQQQQPRSKLPKTTNLFPPLNLPAGTATAAGGPAGILPGPANDLEASMRKFYEDTMKRYMDELQARPSVQQQQQQLLQHQQPQVPAADTSNHQALDLRSSSADLDHGSHRSENDNDSDSWDKNLSGGEDSSSEHNRGLGSEDFDGEMGEGGEGGFGGHSGSGGGGGYHDLNGSKGDGSGGNKRFRTHMSNVQVKMMKSVFEAYKTPTMPECLSLGNQIGLQKRVVQVWFQNARAKEKKARLYLQQVTGQEPELPAVPRGCRWCGLTYPENCAPQEHIFLPQHLDNVRQAIEQGLYDPESPGAVLTQQAEALQNGGGMNLTTGGSSGNRPSGGSSGSHLHHHGTPPRQQDSSATDSSPSPTKPNLGPGLAMMAQMAAAGGLHSPGSGGSGHMADSRGMLMPPFYGMGAYPIGVTNTVHNV